MEVTHYTGNVLKATGLCWVLMVNLMLCEFHFVIKNMHIIVIGYLLSTSSHFLQNIPQA